jgi:hypothetical protein
MPRPTSPPDLGQNAAKTIASVAVLMLRSKYSYALRMELKKTRGESMSEWWVRSPLFNCNHHAIIVARYLAVRHAVR